MCLHPQLIICTIHHHHKDCSIKLENRSVMKTLMYACNPQRYSICELSCFCITLEKHELHSTHTLPLSLRTHWLNHMGLEGITLLPYPTGLGLFPSFGSPHLHMQQAKDIGKSCTKIEVHQNTHAYQFARNNRRRSIIIKTVEHTLISASIDIAMI
jgi:hypothetical protein